MDVAKRVKGKIIAQFALLTITYSAYYKGNKVSTPNLKVIIQNS